MNRYEKKKSPPRKGLVGLFIGILLIVVFLYWVGPWFEQMPLFQPMVDLIETTDIDTGAYYYTDIEEFAEAEFNINQAMTYPPTKEP